MLNLRKGFLATSRVGSSALIRCQMAQTRYFSASLNERMEAVVGEKQAELAAFKKEHGSTVIEQVNAGQVIGGMRGITGMLYETSKLDAQTGIRYRDHELYQVVKNAPTTVPGGEPNIEGVFWLLLTGEYPDQSQAEEIRQELYKRGRLSADVEKLIKSFPKGTHPMTQLSMGVLACQPESKFAKAYRDGIHKSKYWTVALEDALDLSAKISRIAALVYHNSFGDVGISKSISQRITLNRSQQNTKVPDADPSLDYSANFAKMLGFTNEDFAELMRLYLVLHADHEGGNVSAHATMVVGSALSDPYLSYSAGLNGLAGPLHGLANQECLRFLLDIEKEYGSNWNDDDIRNFVQKTMKSGKVIPGYGHAVLRQADPRFVCQVEYADKKIKDSNIVNLVKAGFRVIPDELKKTGKVSNPYPNVDAASGSLLTHYGMTQFDFYTVMFGVSRAFGVMPATVWARALGLPIERPNSVTLNHLTSLAKAKK